MNKRIVYVILFSAMLIGCAANPQKRFAATLDMVRTAPEIDVVIDSFVVSDIRGRTLGYNMDKNIQRATEIKDTVVSVLESKGYKPNVVFVGSGLQQEMVNDTDILYSKDWQSIGENFSEGIMLEGDSSWEDVAAIDYFGAVIEEALGTNWSPPKYDLSLPAERRAREVRLGLTPEQREARKAIFNNKPEAVSKNSSANILFIKYSNIDISANKQFGLSLLTGATSLAASGGKTATVMTVSKLGPMELAVIDKSTEEILWAMSAEDTSIFNTEKKKVNHVLAHFPARN